MFSREPLCLLHFPEQREEPEAENISDNKKDKIKADKRFDVVKFMLDCNFDTFGRGCQTQAEQTSHLEINKKQAGLSWATCQEQKFRNKLIFQIY